MKVQQRRNADSPDGGSSRVRLRRALAALGAAVVIAGLAGCVPQPTQTDAPAAIPEAPRPPTAAPAPTPTPTPPPGVRAEAVTFLEVIDGDTIETSAGTVRIIGIDTPERGECGHAEASASLAGVVARGDAISLELPPGQNAEDRYGRLLRYVTTGSGVDLGMLQLQSGFAVARYDSRDGYPAHPKEPEYHAAQIATLSQDGSVITVTCTPAAFAPAPAPQTPPAAVDRWWEQYSSCSKLKKNTVGHPTGPFRVDDPAQAEIYDWFANRTGNRGDGDGDGLACE